ncbi:SERTA domain-containing protein 3 [Astyanax mexicanus]|uniref:SERTA domain-containing protein 3 n=1 Tax=Astyanax mexicanus TaxID=7994 RepID=UPI000BBDC8F4|nr:SERTA domain-containing protein 3 [Astyanax mexicanus]
MVARGLKRKLHDSEDSRGSFWETQLQSVLDISLDKYQRDQALVEPSLLRSVLINNTLRQVQSEVRTSLTEPTSAWKPQPPPRPQPEFLSQREIAPSGHSASAYSLGLQENEDDFMAWSAEEDFSLSSAISAILKNLDAALDGGYNPPPSTLLPPPPQRTPLASVENLPGDGKFKQNLGFTHMMESCRTSSVGTSAVVSGIFQESTIDDLLMDLDTSVFGREMSSFAPHTFSFPADELMRYLPSLSTSSPAPSSSSGSREIHELEQIMDILIRS